MKLKKIFALALAVCMMVSAMPTTLAADGVLTSGGTSGSGDGVLTSGGSSSLTLTSGGSTVSRITSGSAQPRQDGVLYGSGNEGGTTPVVDPVDDPVIIDTTTYSGENTANGYIGNGGPMAPAGWPKTQPAANGVADPLVTSKKVTWNDATGKYDVRLESYVTGSYETKTTTTVETDPLDVILILDRSSRMTADKMSKLKEAANGFLTELQKNSANSRVAIVSYANQNASTVDTNSNAADYTALVNITASNKVNSVLTTAISNLGTAGSGNAYSDEAFEKAVRIFQSLTTYEARADVPDCDNERMVIFFTAGIPGVAGEGWDYDIGGIFGLFATYPAYNIAQKSIHWSAILKANEGTNTNISSQQFWRSEYYDSSDYGTRTGCGSKVYCVGIDLPTCVNHSHSISNNNCDGTKINEYLYRVSSHRSDGTHVPNDIQNEWENTTVFRNYNYPDLYTKGNIAGSHVTGTKYYLAGAIGDVAGMLNQTISTTTTRQGGPDIELTSAAVLKDVISPYFKLSGAVTVKTAEYDYNVSGNFKNETVYSKHTPSGKTIEITGFDYGENWCGINKNEGKNSPHGKKLIVEFSLVPADGFMGGNNVPTNGYDSGVYAKSTSTNPLEHFSYPLVNVAIPKPVVEVEGEQVIYYGETAPAVSDLYTKITPTETDAWKYDFVKLTYTVPEGINNDDCATYDFKLNVQPIASATTDVGTPAVAIDSDVAQVKVHVLEAVLDAKDDTIYLGDTTDLNELVEHSWACDCEENGKTGDDTNKTPPAVDYVFSGVASTIEGTYAPADHDCEDITVTCNRGNDSDEFTVHVVKPVVEFQDSTIYLGYEPTDDDFEDYNIVKAGVNHKITWTHTKDDGSYTEDYDYPDVTFAFDTKGANYTDCTSVSATVYSGTLESYIGSFTVHVLKPSFSVQDGYIYQGQTKDLTECITLDGWSDKSSCKKNENIVGDEPDKDAFVFIVDGVADVKAFAEMECTPLNVSAASINHKDAIDYFASEDFTVHVLKPHFTVTTTDLWADYGTKVDLYKGGENYSAIDAVTGVSHTWVYNGDCTGDNVHPAELPAGAPTIALKDVTFVEGETHTMGAVDGKVTVSGLKYTNKEIVNEETDQLIEQTASLDDVAISYVDDKGYVALFVNKFDLTINKSWMDGEKVADGTYQQDAIFTVAHGQDTFKVVLPAGQPNVKVTGLLCGQDYTVTEDTAWTWRWESDDAKTVAAETTAHAVSTSDLHEEMTHGKHVMNVSFANQLIKELWLSFCTFVQNIFGQAAIQKGGN